EFTLLLLGAPADQNRRDNTVQGIEYMGQVEPILEELGFQHHLVIHRKPRSAVFFGINGEKPAFCPEFFGETAAELILIFVFASGPGGRPAQVLVTTHLFRQPGADFLSKLDYIWRFCGNIKIHTNLLSKRFPTNSYHSASAELLNSVTIVPQPRQDFFRVFSEQRCRAEKLRRRAGEIDWAPDQITFAHLGMINLLGDAHVLYLWIVENLLDRTDRSIRNVAGIQSPQPMFTWLGAKCFL